jgi:hypothetical protein
VHYYSYGKLTKLTPLKDTRRVANHDIKYYTNKAGQKVGVKNEILAKCKSKIPCLEIFEKYNFEEVEQLTSKLIFIKLKKDQNPFDISNELYQNSDIEFAHPNFIKKRYKR